MSQNKAYHLQMLNMSHHLYDLIELLLIPMILIRILLFFYHLFLHIHTIPRMQNIMPIPNLLVFI